MEELNTELADILEADVVTDTELLDDNDMWDSLAVLSLLAFVDKEYGVNLFADDIKDLKTVAEIKAMIKSKMA